MAADVVEPPVEAFLEAVACAGAVLGSAAVRDSWDRPSALRRMTVGDVAGHVFLVLRRVGQHLAASSATDAPHAQAPPPAGAGWTWLRVVTEDDLSVPEHERVRRDGAHVADWGWTAVRHAYAERASRVGELLRDGSPAAVVVGDRSVSFAAYLATRVIELLVHADDLGSSVGVPVDVPPRAAEVAVRTLADAARATHGDLAVLRVLSRAERAPATISVF